MPETPGNQNGRLAPCPGKPNCVSSDAENPARRIHPLVLDAPPAAAWQAASAAVATLPRTRILTHTDDYLHAECRSRLFRFVDDLELQLRTGEGQIAVRSSSRLGYYDFGVNRRRVEKLRSQMRRMGVLQ